MPITDYPFVQQGGKPRAALPVTLENPDTGLSFMTWALIDTGADNIVVPGYIAKLLGHTIDHDSVEKTVCQGAGGQTHTYYHSFKLFMHKLDANGTVLDDIVIKTNKRTFPVIKPLQFMLLGVNGFLEKYILSIDYPQKKFSVKSH